MSNPEELLTATQAAELLGVNDSRIRQMIRDEGLKAQRFGRAWMLRRGDVEEYHREHRQPEPGRRGRPPKSGLG
jgi:excisionase family DNA binding protein